MKKFYNILTFLFLILTTGAYAACIKNEIFNDFYERFKVDQEFRISRRLFPLKVTEFIGEDEFAKPKILHVNKADVTSGKYILYPNYEIIEDQGYIEVFNDISADEINLLALQSLKQQFHTFSRRLMAVGTSLSM